MLRNQEQAFVHLCSFLLFQQTAPAQKGAVLADLSRVGSRTINPAVSNLAGNYRKIRYGKGNLRHVLQRSGTQNRSGIFLMDVFIQPSDFFRRLRPAVISGMCEIQGGAGISDFGKFAVISVIHHHDFLPVRGFPAKQRRHIRNGRSRIYAKVQKF